MRLALLGSPVAHSRSPQIHRAALQACGIAGEYEAREVDPAGFTAALDELRLGALDGANVTMPYKRAAHHACAVLDPDARRTGAVNTLMGRDGELVGWCTDVGAVRAALAEMPPGPVLVLGAGGAAAAAAVAAAGRPVHLASRHPAAAAELLTRLGLPGVVTPWAEAVPGTILINATPLGMAGEGLPEGPLSSATGLVDMAYGPVPTPAVLAARAAGLPVADGLSILVEQAAAAFEAWTGRAAPRTVMAAAARSGETLKEA